jgi:hypothetical protein
MAFFNRRNRQAVAPVFARAPDELILQTRLESGADLYWRASAGDLEQIEQPGAGRVVSFTPDDYRFAVTQALSVEKAKSFAVRESESAEKLRVVNASRKAGLIYATPVSRLEVAPFAIAPGMQVLDVLLRTHGAQPPVVAGCLFESRDKSHRLAILHAIKESGRTDLSISINPDDMEQVIALFVNSTRLPHETGTLIFSAAEFMGAARGLACYPGEPEWEGIPTRKIATALLLAAALAAGGSLAAAAFHYGRIELASSREADARARLDRMQGRIGATIAAHPLAFAAQVSLPQREIFGTAEQLWVPGSRVSVQAQRAAFDYTVSVPLSTNRVMEGNRPSPYAATDRERVSAVIELQPPQGCSKRDVSTTGVMNEIQVAVSCPAPDTGLAGLGSD